MTPLDTGVAGWIYQQDYITFLAVLGGITAGLVAWGNAAAATDTKSVPWRWFALAAVFLSVDGALDLAEMVGVAIRPAGLDPLFRLVSYGCLLEFTRRNAGRRRWAAVSWVVPVFLPTLALGLEFFLPAVSPAPAIVLAFIAGGLAGVTIMAAVGPGTRPLLAPAVALLLLGVVEVLRGRSGVTIERLYGTVVSGEGFVTAFTSCVLTWVAASGLWLHNVLWGRKVSFFWRTGGVSPIIALGMPGLVVLTLVAGFFLVNGSSTRARHTIEEGYINRVRTAALAIDPGLLVKIQGEGSIDESNADVEQIRRQLLAMRAVGSDLQRVYLWNIVGGRIVMPPIWLVGGASSGAEPAVVRVGVKALPSAGQAHLHRPLGSPDAPVLLANAPVVDYVDGRQVAWLGFDISAEQWFSTQAVARVQTIGLVGLFATVIVFFFALQMMQQFESELRVAKESAEAGDRAKEEFLAVMSHEIRTPMQSVLGYGELMARTPLNGPQHDYLDAIRSQGRTLLRIVQDILDFSILRKSSYNLKRETVYLHRLVESAFETIQPLAAHKELRTTVRIAENVPEVVLGDAVRIEQILLNLLGNAVKFTDEGEVRLEASVAVPEPEHDEAAQVVVFTVSDSGPGIRKEDLRRLFEPFTRLTQAESKPREGAGLGLAIVKRLCQLMGGTVEIESDFGKGTRFVVRLPFVPVTSPAATPATDFGQRPVPARAGEVRMLADILPLRILVVEDNPYIRLLMVEYLQTIGYKPEAVDSGLAAASRWREFDMLIMDLRMPGMDGVTAARQIRAESGSETEPWIVGVSATLAEAEVRRAMDAGMNDFLGKPFFVQSLVEAIEASPLYERRREEAANTAPEPRAEAPAAAEPKNGPKASLPAGAEPAMMSWMPDLSASGTSEIVEQALAEMPAIMDEIGAALDKADAETAADRAHYLKNTILALRIEPMAAPCRTVFERAQAGDLEGARQSLAGLRTAHAAWAEARRRKTAGAGTSDASQP